MNKGNVNAKKEILLLFDLKKHKYINKCFSIPMYRNDEKLVNFCAYNVFLLLLFPFVKKIYV